MVKWENMTDDSYEQIDALFAQIRLRLLEIRQSDPAIAEELKSLLLQLEDYTESLVIDSLKLKSLEGKSGKAAAQSKRKPQKRQVGKDKKPPTG